MDLQAVLEKAALGALEVARDVERVQLELATPCHEWDVRTLADHLVFWTAYGSEEAARKQTGSSHDESKVGHIHRRLDAHLRAAAGEGGRRVGPAGCLGGDGR